MIVFDLKCRKGHVFEAWFRDSAAFETQAVAGKVVCPACGNTKVTKAPMAPNISARRDAAAGQRAPEGEALTGEALAALKRMRDEVEKNCDYVGERFTEEARRIHYGETAKRNIYGEATAEQAAEMQEEGVGFARIPWVRRDDA